MKRTEAARETSEALKSTEAAIAAALESAEQTLARLISAKAELGLTGTVGDAAIARMRDVVAALQDAETTAFDSHAEAAVALKSVDLRARAGITCPEFIIKGSAQAA